METNHPNEKKKKKKQAFLISVSQSFMRISCYANTIIFLLIRSTYLSTLLFPRNPPPVPSWYDLRSSAGLLHVSPPPPRDRGLSVNSILLASSDAPDCEEGLSDIMLSLPDPEPGLLSFAFCPKRTLSSSSRARCSKFLSKSSFFCRTLSRSSGDNWSDSPFSSALLSLFRSSFRWLISSLIFFSSSVSGLKL